MMGTLLANAIVTPGPDTPLCDLADACGMLVATGRAVAPGKWIGSMVERARQEKISLMPHNQC